MSFPWHTIGHSRTPQSHSLISCLANVIRTTAWRVKANQMPWVHETAVTRALLAASPQPFAEIVQATKFYLDSKLSVPFDLNWTRFRDGISREALNALFYFTFEHKIQSLSQKFREGLAFLTYTVNFHFNQNKANRYLNSRNLAAWDDN